jgi:alpha-glucan,water dikinase
MKTAQTIRTGSGFDVQVETAGEGGQMEVVLRAPAVDKRCLLHWGVRSGNRTGWALPPQSAWPPDTRAFGPTAVQTPFSRENGHSRIVIRLAPAENDATLEFDLFFPDEGRWDNNGGRNYQVALSEPPPNPLTLLRAHTAGQEISFERVFDVEGNRQVAVAVTKARNGAEAGPEETRPEDEVDSEGSRAPERRSPEPKGCRVWLCCNLAQPLALYWGVARRSPHEWQLPPESVLPPGTVIVDQKAAQSPFATRDGLATLILKLPDCETPLGIQFVLCQTDAGGRWIKYRGGNFYVPIHAAPPQAASAGIGSMAGLADEIIRAEAHNSWTLMHRFNLAHDLLDQARNNPDGQALLYVWLRFSAIRQLTWQRNFNTKPRELAHAQDRLTQKLAEAYRSEPASRPLLRLTLSTVGRGGEGQRIRDEILNIMHRHHVKEVGGHFLEEWHQKLHNNTTPDDVVICEAFLEFLRTQGNHERFYHVLEAGGVTRQRLESFERPIRSQPDFVPHMRDALLHDFGEFLKILKAAHSGTDLDTALEAVRNRLDGGMQDLLRGISSHRNDGAEALPGLVDQITEARRRLSNLLHQGEGLRELLYLDLALEQLIRRAVERNLHLRPGGEALADLIARILENVTLSYEDPELAACSRQWERLQHLPRLGQEWSLHAKSVADRIARGLTAWIDRFYQFLQPKAEYLGRGLGVEPWTISLFSEEVVRGGSLGFVLSMLLHQLDPLLRKAAHLGAWQIISRGHGAGVVEVADSLHSIQRRHFEHPVVVIADHVMGDEELPEQVTAVVAPDVTDIVSHVAVRARNGGVLFAACHDPDQLQRLKSLKGHAIQLEVSPAGDIVVRETAAQAPAPTASRHLAPATRARPKFSQYALSVDEFDERRVGSKSLHQARLRGKLPDWIRLPASAALPFGVFEKVLGLEPNRGPARRYSELAAQVAKGGTDTLASLRETVLALAAPEELKTALRQATARAGLAWPDNWSKAWERIKQVWASKWNERAVLSREKMGLPHEDLVMAVLIQQVVPADYAFVIHTTNPSTGDAGELFAEVVLGLGETLVGNYPGRALSFVWNKAAGQPTVLSFPAKSAALYGRGLIFRSDSNGEDLAGFAGAGLYDSVLLDEPRQAAVDYTEEPLVWDEPFRRGLMTAVARIGLEVERSCGAAQDIEGAVAQDQYYVVQTRPQVG